MTVPGQTGASADWQESVETRLRTLENGQSLGITQASMVLAAQFHERQQADRREREADWKRTYNAVLPQMLVLCIQDSCAIDPDEDDPEALAHRAAARCADRAHGPLPLVVNGPVNVSAESLAKGGKMFELATYPCDDVNGLINAAERVLDLWNEFNCQEMYGEMLRDGMDETADFERWEAAHDALREARRPFGP